MFPNPQDALPLPAKPNLEQYKKRAKDLTRACKSTDPGAIESWARQWLDALSRSHVERSRSRLNQWLASKVTAVSDFARREMVRGTTSCSLASAQFVIARSHGFTSWPRFSEHIVALSGVNSAINNFETAAEAIVSGDLRKLRMLLRDEPDLIRARSTREHNGTLLHYVSANGVETYRQHSPKNAKQVAEVLLKAGAEVDATARVYGGECTALSLVATSTPPLRAGVQNELIETLLEYGARVEEKDGNDGIVVACLNNGCPEAAELLSRRGARLTLYGAAGIGRLDLVKSYFTETGKRKRTTSKADALSALSAACAYGQTKVVEFMLNSGIDPNLKIDGATALHPAAYGGHVAVVRLLLDRGVAVGVRDDRFDGTALDWALHGWAGSSGEKAERFYDLVNRLVRAGADVDQSWLTDSSSGPVSERVRSDARMFAALEVTAPGGEGRSR